MNIVVSSEAQVSANKSYYLLLPLIGAANLMAKAIKVKHLCFMTHIYLYGVDLIAKSEVTFNKRSDSVQNYFV